MTDAPFYYTAKASRSERNMGCEDLFWRYQDDNAILISEEEYLERKALDERVAVGCCHPTVKAIEIMEWLIVKLTEPGDTVLDPFAGSGTTGIAAMRTGRDVQLIELNDDGSYEHIIRGRLEGHREAFLEELPVWARRPNITLPGDTESEDAEPEQVSLGQLFG